MGELAERVRRRRRRRSSTTCARGCCREPVKTSRNMAYYPPEFVERIRLIKQLQEERFMPLRVIKELLDAADGDVERLRSLADTATRWSRLRSAPISGRPRTSCCVASRSPSAPCGGSPSSAS